MDMHSVVATLAGSPITVADVIVHLKANGTFRTAVYQIIENEVVRAKCRDLAVDIREDELDAYAQARRSELGLDDAVKMNQYCRWLGITFDDWSDRIESEFLRSRLARRVIDDAAVTRFYDEHQEELKTVSVSRIVCRSESEISLAGRIIKEEGRDFSSVARELSIEKGTRLCGGFMGSVRRGWLSPEVDRAVFGASDGTVLGPFVENGQWTLYKVEDIAHAELDDELRRRISDQLFARWLEVEVHRAEA
jgi:hypothetical protein